MRAASRICLILLAAGLAACQTTANLSYTPQEQEQAFRSADANGNGTLDSVEFRRYVDLMAAKGSRDAKRAKSFGADGYSVGFSRADGNGDGKVSLQETKRFV